MNFLQDVKTAAAVFRQAREARKEGKVIRPVYKVQVIRMGYFTFTMEACLIYSSTFKAVCAVFERLPEDTQHALTFSPKEPGGWAERVRFWQRHLRPALSPKMYHAVMMRFIRHYARCVRRRAAA